MYFFFSGESPKGLLVKCLHYFSLTVISVASCSDWSNCAVCSVIGQGSERGQEAGGAEAGGAEEDSGGSGAEDLWRKPDGGFRGGSGRGRSRSRSRRPAARRPDPGGMRTSLT